MSAVLVPRLASRPALRPASIPAVRSVATAFEPVDPPDDLAVHFAPAVATPAAYAAGLIPAKAARRRFLLWKQVPRCPDCRHGFDNQHDAILDFGLLHGQEKFFLRHVVCPMTPRVANELVHDCGDICGADCERRREGGAA